MLDANVDVSCLLFFSQNCVVWVVSLEVYLEIWKNAAPHESFVNGSQVEGRESGKQEKNKKIEGAAARKQMRTTMHLSCISVSFLDDLRIILGTRKGSEME